MKAVAGTVVAALACFGCANAEVSEGFATPPLGVDPTPLAGVERRGLLASAGFDSKPLKGIYFFPGEGAAYNMDLYTAHPQNEADLHWNSDPSSRAQVIDRMVQANANTLIMSYWGNDMSEWSPMALDASSIPGVLDSVSGRELLVIPALESGFDENQPTTPHWRFAEDFPYVNGTYDVTRPAPSFVARLREVIGLFQGHEDSWAQMYDRNGAPRYVVNILHACALTVPTVSGRTADQIFADAFDQVAQEIKNSDGLDVGFTLDPFPCEPGAFSLSANASGSALESVPSVLAIQGFISEIASGVIISSASGQPPHDNNRDNLDQLISWKSNEIRDWVNTGVPVLYDVSPGYDGRFVWRDEGTAFWGDNYDYTSDDWRNALSARKGTGIVGITFNAWNGFTEGLAAGPTVEHASTVSNWLRDLYRPDPRECDHVEYVQGAPSRRVSGAICAKWRDLGADRGPLGAPASDELISARGRMVHFAAGSVLTSDSLGTHEVHGAIHVLYAEMGYDSSCLGFPISDEEASPNGAVSHFEHGDIVFKQGQAQSTCR